MLMAMLLRSSRILLRAVEPEDLDLMYLIENDTQLWTSGVSTVPYSRYALRQFILNSSNDIHQDKQLRLVIETTEGVAVGFVDLQDYDALHLRAEVGIVLVLEAQGKGYAQEALCLLSDYARLHLQIRILYAFVSVDNPSAISLFQKSGYQRSGQLPLWIRNHDAIVFTKVL